MYDDRFDPSQVDGKDLYDAHTERIMEPSLDEQMSSPEFRLASLEMWVSNWTPRIQKINKFLQILESRMLPDDFDTHAQVEEQAEIYDEMPDDECKNCEDLMNCWPEFVKVRKEDLPTELTLDGVKIRFPNLETALHWAEANPGFKND